jgi:hypothetical protein
MRGSVPTTTGALRHYDAMNSRFGEAELSGNDAHAVAVCKRKDSPYKVTEKPSRYWIKIKNSRYVQLGEREELFEQK